MALLNFMVFNRTLRQFLNCKDMSSDKGVALSAKMNRLADDFLEKILETIPSAPKPQSGILKTICSQKVQGPGQELLLAQLAVDATEVRATAVDILSQASRVNLNKLLKRLHDPGVSTTEVIDILESQKRYLCPEQLVNHAIKLEKTDAQRLLDIAEKLPGLLNLDRLHAAPEMITSPSIKMMLLHYFAQLQQPEIAGMISPFLADHNKAVVFEALNSLKTLSQPFDAEVVLPYIEALSESERERALEIVIAQANTALVPKLAPGAAGGHDDVRMAFIALVVKYATTESLEQFLQRLDLQEPYGKEQAAQCLLRLGTRDLGKIANRLGNHKQAFVCSTAQQLAKCQGNPVDFDHDSIKLLDEDWQIREKAIAAIGQSNQRDVLPLLKKVVQQWPTSAANVLQAVSALGFSKGLEIAFICLKMPEAVTQRQALMTIAHICNQKHAISARSMLLGLVPKLQATVKDTAEEVISQLTKNFSLAALEIEQTAFFETRLSKVERGSSAKKPPVIQSQVENIETLKKNDIWKERYRIRSEVGRGTMGRVMLVQDLLVDEELVLKFMHPELTANSASRERFLREVKYARKISHLNVIRIHDMLTHKKLCAISMEYFSSRGLDEILQKKKYLPPKAGLNVLYQVASGMSAAHRQKVIHRDLKSSNILMNNKGEVKVVDFGIASVSSSLDSTLTNFGTVVGTPAYLAPERARGQEASNSSDIYALGIIAYNLFTGRLPYQGDSMAVLLQHMEGKAVPIHQVRRSIPASIGHLVQKLMAVDIKHRIQTMADVCAAIQEIRKK